MLSKFSFIFPLQLCLAVGDRQIFIDTSHPSED